MQTCNLPLTVVRVKFKGTAHRFFYAAFFLEPENIPTDFGKSEKAEIEFWRTYDWTQFPIGTGTTSGSAQKDLYRRFRFVTELKQTGGAKARFLPMRGAE